MNMCPVISPSLLEFKNMLIMNEIIWILDYYQMKTLWTFKIDVLAIIFENAKG